MTAAYSQDGTTISTHALTRATAVMNMYSLSARNTVFFTDSFKLHSGLAMLKLVEMSGKLHTHTHRERE